MNTPMRAMLARAAAIAPDAELQAPSKTSEPAYAALDLTYPNGYTLCVDLLPEPDFLTTPFAGMRPETIVLVARYSDGTRLRTNTDLGIVTEAGAGVHDAQIVLAAHSTLSNDELTAILDEAFLTNALRARAECETQAATGPGSDSAHWYDASQAAIEALAHDPQEARLGRLRHAAEAHLHPLMDPEATTRYHLTLRPRSLAQDPVTVHAIASNPSDAVPPQNLEPELPPLRAPHTKEDLSAFAVAKAFQVARHHLEAYRNIVKAIGTEADRRFAANDCDEYDTLIEEIRALVPHEDAEHD